MIPPVRFADVSLQIVSCFCHNDVWWSDNSPDRKENGEYRDNDPQSFDQIQIGYFDGLCWADAKDDGNAAAIKIHGTSLAVVIHYSQAIIKVQIIDEVICVEFTYKA